MDLQPLLVAWVGAHALLLAYVLALRTWSRLTGA